MRHPPATLSIEQQARMLAAVGRHQRDYTLLTVALGTALREMELCALNCGDVYSGYGNVRDVVHLRVYKNLPGNTQNNAHLQSIHLPATVQEALKSFRQWKKRRGQSVDADAPLFSSEKGGGRLITRALRHRFRIWCTNAGFSEVECRGLSFHSLRHTAITNFYRLGGRDLPATARFARHTSQETTLIYTHAMLDEVAVRSEDVQVTLQRARDWQLRQVR